jgi:ubiquinone/menaquinone biosynthesis C-methylase UbiE
MRVDTYTHGHHDSVLRSHRWRTVDNSAGYLVPHLRAGLDLLDVGCGPGTITLDLATRVAPGAVVGVDPSEVVLAEARALADSAGVAGANMRFETASAYALELPDDSFDIVHAHQVLQHLTDPVGALREMRRVLRPDGILAVRDSDYGTFVWGPDDPLLERWRQLFFAVTARNGADAAAGRHLLQWVHAAGFRQAEATSTTWTFADPDSRAWWGGLWADRVLHSSFGEQALDYGLSDEAELAAISAAWRRWAARPDGFYALLHGEVLARP